MAVSTSVLQSDCLGLDSFSDRITLTLLTSLSLCDLICRMRIKTITCLKFIVRLK